MRIAITQYNGLAWLQGLPLAAGLLSSTVRRDRRLGVASVNIHTARLPTDTAIRELAKPDILALSCYCWNERYSLEIGRLAKAAQPELKVILGGPSIPRDAAAARTYLEAHPFVDVLVRGEGEQTFCELLLAIRNAEPLDAVPGLALRADDPDQIVVTTRRERLHEFAQTGSPYLDGTFDALLAAGTLDINMAAIETNRGCPFSCTFCDWGQATRSRVHELPLERVIAELNWAGEHAVPFLYFIDANFGIRPRDEQIIEHVARVRQRTGFPAFCYFHMTKNAQQRNMRTMEVLKAAGIGCRMALSMQDFDERVLVAIKRDNIRPERALALRGYCHEKEIPTFNELILGLPEQTYESFCAGVLAAVTPYPQDTFDLYLCRLLEGTELASAEHRQRFGIETVHCRSVGPDPSKPAYVEESEEIVVGTATLDRAEWRRAYRFGFLVHALLVDAKLRFIVEPEAGNDAVRRERLERLLDAIDATAPGSALAAVSQVFADYLASIESGGPLLLHQSGLGDLLHPIEHALAATVSTAADELKAALEWTADVQRARATQRGSKPRQSRATVSEIATTPMFDASTLLDDPAALRERAARDGAVWLPGLLPASQVQALRERALIQAIEYGWLDTRAPLDSARGVPQIDLGAYDDDRWHTFLTHAVRWPEFTGLRTDPRLLSAVETVAGGAVAAEHGDLLRVVSGDGPGLTTGPHQDAYYIRGDADLWTAWLPLGPCPRSLGPLAVIVGSHRDGHLDHHGTDVQKVAHVTENQVWHASDLAAGDVIIFHGLTVHRALPNRCGPVIRLSADFRYRCAASNGTRPGSHEVTATLR